MFSNISNYFQKKHKKQSLFKEYIFQNNRDKNLSIWHKIRDYNYFANYAYINNVIAAKAIRMFATSVASVDLTVNKYNSEQECLIIKNHKLLSLLKHPNINMSGKELIRHIVSYLLIDGNAYLLKLKQDDNTAPVELHILRPDRVKVLHRNGKLIGYTYKVNDITKEYKMNEGRSSILHFKNFHPTNDWYGLSYIESAAYSIEQHNSAMQWNQSLLLNLTRPGGILMSKNFLTDEQFSKLEEQLIDCYSGKNNAGKPMLLEGDLSWQENKSNSPKEMDFLNIKNSAARDIALAFDVPPQLLGIPGDNTYTNMSEARLAFWEQTVLPMLNNIINHLNNWLAPEFDSNIYISYDQNTISALSTRQEKIWNLIEKADFMTINEKRSAIGLKPINGGDEIYKN